MSCKKKDKGIQIGFAIIAAACFIYSVSIVFVNQIPLIPGSFLGIAVTLYKLIGSPVGIVNLLLNIPVLFLCIKIFHPKVLYYTIFVIVSTSFLIDMLEQIMPASYELPMVIIVIIGGALMGIAAGLILICEGTMAGTTALCRIIQKKIPGLKVGTLLMGLDLVIVLMGSILIHDWMALVYSAIYTVMYSVVIDIAYFAKELITQLK